MNVCNKCGLLANACNCGKKEAAAKTSNCKTCNMIHRTDYLIYGNCHDCHSISQMEPTDREYYRTLAAQYRFKLVDMPTHVMAANRKNQPIEEYLADLPRNAEAFREYFKGKNITIGGERLEL